MKYRKRPVVIDAWQFTKKNYKAGAPHFIRHSDGAQLELDRAKALGKQIIFYENILTYAHERGMILV